MEYINQRNLIIATGLLVVIALGGFAYFYAPVVDDVTPSTDEVAEMLDETATTTPQETDTTENESTGETTVTVTQETQTTTPAPQAIVKKDLGPRQKADSPNSALTFFAEAMVANDFERAASYFFPHLRAQYQAEFEAAGRMGAQHAVVSSYYSGTVDPVELIDPDNGIYEIAVYPLGSPLPFRTNYAYNAETGEFLFTEF